MSFSNVKSRLVDGALHFYSKVTGNDILVLDPDTDEVMPGGIGGLRACRFEYNPTADASVRALGAHDISPVIPDNALILYGIIEILETLTDEDDDSATLALSVQSANDLVTATAISSGTFWDAVKAKAVVPDALRLAGIATSIKLTAARRVVATVGDDTINVGKLVGWLFYVIGD